MIRQFAYDCYGNSYACAICSRNPADDNEGNIGNKCVTGSMEL